jgi:hypothetical protein
MINLRDCGNLPMKLMKRPYEIIDATIEEAFEARFGAVDRAVVHCPMLDLVFEMSACCTITIKCKGDDNPAIIIMEGTEPSFIINISKSIMRTCDIYRVSHLRGKKVIHREMATLILRLGQLI